MTGQLESLIPELEQQGEQDTVIQDVCEEITGTLQQAFTFLIERRDQQYEDAIKPLEAEQMAMAQESASIEETAVSLEQILPAKARIAQYEADQLTVAGKSEEAEAKREEMRQAEAAPAALRTRQEEIARRIEAIAEEKRACARRIFKPWHGECQSVIRVIERGLFLQFLDALWNEYLNFESRTCPQRSLHESPMVRSGHRSDLTAGERSELWISGNRWYSGRGRR